MILKDEEANVGELLRILYGPSTLNCDYNTESPDLTPISLLALCTTDILSVEPR